MSQGVGVGGEVAATLTNSDKPQIADPAKEISTAAATEEEVKITPCEIKTLKIEETDEKEELLGSVTTRRYPGLRTSARFMKKQPRPNTPTQGRDQQQQHDQQITPKASTTQVRHNTKSLWSNVERNHFFDALHEFGKDFEAIGNFINGKLKRRSLGDVCSKSKDQVRIHYYQTFHKVCKYVKFSDEVKKPVQELYALINYGEMRRKLQFVPDKHLKKLKHLVYQGHTTVRCKGKNIRIKTPSCKALRRLNQLDDSLDDIKLPARIDVIVSPSSMMDFGRVQCIAQNPRVRTTVPMNKKLINFIKTFQYKWRSAEAKLAEEEPKIFDEHKDNNDINTTNTSSRVMPSDGEICFIPKPGAVINRPLLSITEYLSSGNICLSAYEDRMGVKLRGESLMQERSAATTTAANCKRVRTDSGSDKRSPEMKKYKLLLQSPVVTASNTTSGSCPAAPIKEEVVESSGDDDLSDDINELQINEELPAKIETQEITEVRNTTNNNNNNNKRLGFGSHGAKSYKPLLDEQTIRRIHKGWTLSTAGDITVGDLYVVLGSDARLELQYHWHQAHEMLLTSPLYEKQNALPYNPQEIENTAKVKNVANSSVSNKLKHLLLMANLSDRLRKKQCNCGHVCDRGGAKARTYVSPRIFAQNSNGGCGHENGFFRAPVAPPRRAACNIDPVKQLNNLQLSKSQKLARQVLVQRMLLPTSGNQMQDAKLTTTTTPIMTTPKAVVLSSMPLLDAEPEIEAEPTKTDNTTIKTTTNQLIKEEKKEDVGEEIVCEKTNKSDNEARTSFTGTIFNNNNNKHDIDTTIATTTNEIKTTTTLHDSGIDDCSSTSNLFNSMMSPMHLIRDSTSNSRWLEENLHDFSLTSLLGHLDEITGTRDLLDSSCNMSVISESSVDYRHKFQEATAMMQNQEQEQSVSK